MKILHIVSNLRHGGVQSWVMDLMRCGSPDNVQMDVLTYSDQVWPYTDEIGRLGGKVHSCVNHRNPVSLFQTIQKINRVHGPYDAIHAHELYNNGITCLIGSALRIPVRISHSHNSGQGFESRGLRTLYNKTMSWLASRYATDALAVSDVAGQKLYGDRWLSSAKFGVLHCGIDLSSYSTNADRDYGRASLGLPAEAKVAGHVGRFFYQKNHDFLLNSVALAMRDEPNLWLVLVGVGELKDSMETRARHLGIDDRVIFAGARDDVPQLMLGCFDLLLLPSHFEGLPIVALEAQAAGLPLMLSDVVSTEADVIPELITRLSLQDDPEIWARSMRKVVNHTPAVTQEAAILRLQDSNFSIVKSYQRVKRVYERNVEAA